MKKLLWCFLIFIGFFNAFGQSDFHGKAFVFPRETANSYVSLKAQLKKALNAFTVCVYFYSELAPTRGYSIFSYATRKSANDILIFRSKESGYLLGVGGPELEFKVYENAASPTHLCATWESASGIAELWVNGKPRVRKSLQKGYTVGSDASIILGQDQDSFGGDFDAKQSLVGDIGDVNMWDFVLSPEMIRSVYRGGTNSPNMLNWRQLMFSANGDVYIKPKLWV
ncbi:C-reactive protein isoform X3 [Tupaia chinensis]|uniref:Pentraxin family member n=1 Tax=Tupaia chinensis TaxID=246437 RepID=L8Y6J1_TUPCH|nr:C-reactive protein isoform X1 [Tupaia chinensis]XP_006168913.1 C-reactive protein isoform X3 [Tupaia chinensis]ELV10595.1 C-reactive protein [Tupaia chinensis]